MAGALSGHIIDSYNSANQRLASPFGQSSGSITSHSPSYSSTNISTHGAMSFNPQMHGNFQSQPSFSFDSHSSFMELSDATTIKIATLQAKLNQKLGPEFISQRPGPGGGPKLTYAEGWKIINLANDVFGFNGWSSNVISLTTDFIDYNEETRRYNVGVTAIMRVTLRDGVFHEDIGYGLLENSKSKGAALDKCKKEAVTDGLKRSLRNFGNLLGNCLYDKSYTQEVIKIKVPPPKFDKNELHRRPEFEESKPNIGSTSTPTAASSSANKSYPTNNTRPQMQSTVTPNVKAEHPPQQQPSGSKPLSSLPSHMRSEVRASTSAVDNVTPDNKGKGKAPASGGSTGLNTPITTPVQPHLQSRPQQQPQPPQYHQPRVPAPLDRKVTFTEPVTPNAPNLTSITDNEGVIGDESFDFSDDDAFLAAVDLGEGDLGRPIDFEEGTGGGRSDVLSDGSFTEANGGPSGDGPTIATDVRPNQPILNQQLPSHLHNQRQPQSLGPAPAPAPAPAQHTNHNTRINTTASSSSSSSGATGMLTRLLPQQPQQQRIQPTNSNHSGQKNSSTTSSASNRSNENRNPNPTSANVVTTNVPAKRAATPSIGGFHFPPGMDSPLAQGKSGPPQAPQRSSGVGQTSSGTTLGTKRSADMMQGPLSRRPAQGMGLAQQQGTVRREPLGRLDFGEDGDVKRVRR